MGATEYYSTIIIGRRIKCRIFLNTDETDECQTRVCGENEFRCNATGRCIPSKLPLTIKLCCAFMLHSLCICIYKFYLSRIHFVGLWVCDGDVDCVEGKILND